MFLPHAAAVRRFNEICNHPAVLPWIRETPYEPLDLTPWLVACVVLTTDRGGLIAVRHGGMAEVHTAFLPECRGREALGIGRAAFRILFRDAVKIVASIPAHNRAACRMAREIGMTFDHETPPAWRTSAGLVCNRVYSADRLTWTGER